MTLPAALRSRRDRTIIAQGERSAALGTQSIFRPRAPEGRCDLHARSKTDSCDCPVTMQPAGKAQAVTC
jgi:hypothetical protein